MQAVRGQWNFDTQDIGFILDGFELPPVILSSWHWSYYNRQMENFGIKKVKDLNVYNIDLKNGYTIPERFIRLNDRIAKRYNITTRTLDKSRLVDEARLIVRLTNEALAGNWGFYPVDESEAEALAKDLDMILHPEAVVIAEIDGKPIGYLLALPDINTILKDLKGKLFPFGIFKLLMNVKKINRYRIWAMGIIKPWQEKGISALMFQRLNESLAHKKPYLEVNWILEDNALMNNAVHHLKFNLVKKYRIYELTL